MMLSVAQGGNDRGLEGGRRKARNCFRGRIADIQGEGTGRARTERKCSALEPSGLLSALLPQGYPAPQRVKCDIKSPLREGTSRANGQIHKVSGSESRSQERKLKLPKHREKVTGGSGSKEGTSTCPDVRSRVCLWTLAQPSEHLSDMNETQSWPRERK